MEALLTGQQEVPQNDASSSRWPMRHAAYKPGGQRRTVLIKLPNYSEVEVSLAASSNMMARHRAYNFKFALSCIRVRRLLLVISK